MVKNQPRQNFDRFVTGAYNSHISAAPGLGAAAVAPVFGANMNRRGKKGEAMNTKNNQNAILRILSKVWGRSPMKKATALAVMLVITVSCVTTVMADSRRATVYYNDELYSGTLLTSLATVQDAQKQLLSISRIMLSEPRMLILDEATSSIDTRTEMMIQEAFMRLMEGRTSFIVAHRLSTIQSADLILVVKDGDVIESGTHRSLMEKGGFYASMYMSQFSS